MIDAGDDGGREDPVEGLLKDGEPREPVEEMRLLADLQDRLFGTSNAVVTLSRYIVLERLAVGGAGVVYTAYDPELDRKVAIKLLNARPRNDDADSETRSRLLREAQAMARLSHPNVIAVYDVGTYDENETRLLKGESRDEVPPKGVFVVMELVDGKNLADWLRADERSWSEVLDAFLAAGRGLVAAHAGGVIHRDFKPANVLVGDDGRIRVLDFGLARAVGEPITTSEPTVDGGVRAGDSGRATEVPLADPTGSTRKIADPPDDTDAKVEARQAKPFDGSLTQPGTIMGTPAYMAPEQHRGSAYGEAVDQFSYCAALYEGLYGQLPFAGRTLEALDSAKASGAVEAAPRNKKVPAWLHRAVMRGLAADPSARFGSMAELLQVLERGLRRRRRRVSAAGALVVAAGVGGFALTWGGHEDACAGQADRLAGVWDPEVKTNVEAAFDATHKPFASAAWQSVERELDGYAKRWVRMRTEVCEANLAPDEDEAEVLGRRSLCLDRRLARLGELTTLFRDADAEVVERAVDAVGSLAPLEHCAGSSSRMGGMSPVDSQARAKVLEIDAELARAEALRYGGRYADAIEPVRAAVEAAREVGHAPTLTRALLVLAGLRLDAGDPSAAEDTLHRALQSAERVGDDELALRALVDLTRVVVRDRARYEDGERLAMLAAAKLDFRGLRDEVDAQLALELGALRKAQGRYEEALRALDDARELTTRLFGAKHQKVADVLNQIGHVHDDRGHYEDALARYEEALELRTTAFGPDHPKVAASLNNLGNIRTKQGRHDDALADYRRSVEIYERALGPDHLRTATPIENVGIVLWKLDDDDGALEYLRRALRIRSAALAADHPAIAGSYNNIGVVLEEQEKYDEALEHYRKALDMHEGRVGPEHPYFALALSNVAGALAKQGRNQDALAHHQRALDIRERALGSEHPDVAASLRDMAEVLVALGRKRAALEHVDRALSIARKGAMEPKALAEIETLHREIAGPADGRQGVATEG